MFSSKFQKNIYRLISVLIILNIPLIEALADNLSCLLIFNCPNDTLVVNSIHPDSTGRPTVLNPSLLDTIYYKDNEVVPPCTDFAIDRTWYLIDTNGDTCTCVQRLDMIRDLSKIMLPPDTTIQTCLSSTELTDIEHLGTPAIYGIPLVNYEYRHGIIITIVNVVISTYQIKRDFYYIDSCDPILPPQLIGHQYINLQYPYLDLLELNIKDPTQTNFIDEICNEDAAHFCLLSGGIVPSYNSVDTIIWEYNDNQTGWQDVQDPDFDKFCFVVPSGKINIDCANSSTGFTERIYRAKVRVVTPISMDTCDYISDADTLIICCPIDPASSISILTNTQMCEGDTQTVQVTLNSNDFIETIISGTYASIDWKINGNIHTNLANISSFSHFVTAGTNDYCFEATITNCGGKQLVVSKCIQIDPKPICGTIIGLATPPNLTQISTNPKVYTICPDNDAALGIDQAFSNCITQWEYSFDLSVWHNLSYSNSVQNTNILPSHLWPANTDSIYYRISCQPLSNPSACVPCNSDTLKIKLEQAPNMVSIIGNSPMCSGNNTTLSISNPQTNTNPPITYTWLHNGAIVGTGTNYSANAAGCYWVEASNGCQVTPSNQFCLEVCEIAPIISCPLMPNECAYLGQSITLSACDSQASCGNTGLAFQWAYDSGTLISTNGCTIEHIPAPLGTTYTLTVTDTNGCTVSTTRFIKPCSN